MIKIHITIMAGGGPNQFDWEGETPIAEVWARLDKWFDLVSTLGVDAQQQVNAAVAKMAEHRKNLEAAPRP